MLWCLCNPIARAAGQLGVLHCTDETEAAVCNTQTGIRLFDVYEITRDY